MKLNQGSGNRVSLIVVDLHHQRVFERGAGGAYLVAATGFNQGGSLRSGLQSCNCRG